MFLWLLGLVVLFVCVYKKTEINDVISNQNPYIKLCIAQGKNDVVGETFVKFTLFNEKTRESRVISPTMNVPDCQTFYFESNEIVTQINATTPDQQHHVLHYPRMNGLITLHSYYSDWFDKRDSAWTDKWIPNM